MMKTLKTGDSENSLLGIRRKSLGCKIGFESLSTSYELKTRVTTNIKELITRVTSDRVYRYREIYRYMEWIDSIDTELVVGWLVLLNTTGILLYMGLSEWLE